MPAPDISPFEVERTDIDELYILRPKRVSDERGTVREFYRESAFVAAGLPGMGPWVQINLTETGYGAIRGMHSEAMTKLVGVIEGEAFGAYVDLRLTSGTRGRVVTVPLTNGTQVLVPQGVGNGFQATTAGGAQYLYCFDNEWQPGMSGVAVHPLDPDLAIRWPIAVDTSDPTQLSEKDAALPLARDVLGF